MFCWRLGYGGSEGRGMVTRASNDGGIDGVIDQDALGLSKNLYAG